MLTPTDRKFEARTGTTRLSSLAVQVSDRGRNTQKTVRNRLESVCAGLWAPSRVFWAWPRPVWGPIWVPTSTIPGRILKSVRGSFSSADIKRVASELAKFATRRQTQKLCLEEVRGGAHKPKSAPKPDETKPKMTGAVPTNRHKPIPNDFGPVSVFRRRSENF